MRSNTIEQIGSDLGRTRIKPLSDGCVVKMRVRTPEEAAALGDPRRVWHKATLRAGEPLSRLEAKGFPARLLDDELFADTGVTLRDVLEEYLRPHRSPLALDAHLAREASWLLDDPERDLSRYHAELAATANDPRPAPKNRDDLAARCVELTARVNAFKREEHARAAQRKRDFLGSIGRG